MDMLQGTCPQSGQITTTIKELSAKWTDHWNGENFLQVQKMDGAFKGDITATKWMDHHDDKRTVREADGSPKQWKFLQVHKMDGAFKGDITATKWTDHHDAKRTVREVDGSPKRWKFFTSP